MQLRHFWLILLTGLFSCQEDTDNPNGNWQTYLGDNASSQYSALDQIDTTNVSTLKVAWTFDSGEAHPQNRSQIQCNPLVVDGVVYATTATLKLVALDGITGEKLWQFDPYDGDFQQYGMGVNRGLILNQGEDPTLFYSAGKHLYAVNPFDGSIKKSFGKSGKINLQECRGSDVALSFSGNTPGIIYKDILIMGGRVSESTEAAPGHIRAFDIRTGEQRWIFHTIPKPDEFGYETWPEDAFKRIGGANVWAGMALDEGRGIVYCPTGSAAYDFYGGDRHGDNLFANCLLALDANTGERLWHYQTIHHDMWDKDLPSPPNLITVRKDGNEIPAVAQITKNGFLFVFNRVTGDPIFPVEEKEVPMARLDGEKASRTQPVPTGYPNFSRIKLTESDLATRNPDATKFAKTIWESTFHKAGPFEPLSETGTIIFPGYDGGGEWGGAAYDHKNGNLIINSNEVPWLNIMDSVLPATEGENLYRSFCQNCHGNNFQGNQAYGNIPSLLTLKETHSLKDASQIIKLGKGIMPAFGHLTDEKIESIYKFITNTETGDKAVDSSWPYPYRMRGYEKLYAPDGFPMITPPWGQLTSIDVNSAKINWQIPLGTHKELEADGLFNTGTENYGGPVITSGGLIFIAATMDNKIRAFNEANGNELWSHDLPAAGYATPATYSIDGKQYVLIGCGGGKLGSKSGDTWVAFSL